MRLVANCLKLHNPAADLGYFILGQWTNLLKDDTPRPNSITPGDGKQNLL
jgi:hypothetical protein